MKNLLQKLALCCLLLGATAAVHAQFSGSGSGTSGNPYIITTPEQLNEVRNDLTANYKLANDIDLASYLASGGNGYAQWGDAGWLPIGEITM